MRRIAPFVLLLSIATVAAGQSDTAALVEAAKQSKPKKKASSTHVITNADVKRSKGKVVQGKGGAEPKPSAPAPTLSERYQTARAARSEAETRVTAATARVERLRKESAELEKSYFDENDLDRRDGEILTRFNEVHAVLVAAEAELADATAALEAAVAAESAVGQPGAPSQP